MANNGATSDDRRARTEALLDSLLRSTRREALCAQVMRDTGAPAPLVEDVLQDACVRGWRGKCRGQSMAEVYKWLHLTTVRLAHDRLKLAHSRREVLVASLGDGGGGQLVSPGAEDEVLGREKEREMAALASAALADLDDRQRAVAALHSHGFTGSAIAERLQTSERRVKHLKAEVFAGARDALVGAAGGGCSEGERLVGRYSFGLAKTDGRLAAQLHIASCEQCGTLYRRLERAHETIAALLPIPALVEADPTLLERAAHKSADAFMQGKQQLSDVVAQGKQQAAASYARALDYTPLAGARPGAAATAIAGCLALGGGAATYCVENNVNPVTGFIDAVRTEQPPPRPPTDKTRVAQQTPDPPLPPITQEPPTPPPPAPEPIAATPAPEAAPQPTAPPPPPTPPEPTPPAVQFGEPATAAAAPATASPPPTPAPVPESGGTDLYGP